MRSSREPIRSVLSRWAGDSATRLPKVRLWPALSPRVYIAGSPDRPPFPLEEGDCALFARGRHALWHGVRGLGLEPGEEVLAPAYHCGSEVEALSAAGLTCRFYEATEMLEPDASELEALIGGRTRALFLIHYYGFPQDAARWRSWCDARGLILIEDCAHAWLVSRDGHPVGSFGQLAVFSPYKTVPTPPVGVLRSSSAPAGERSSGGLGADAVAKKHLRWLTTSSGLLDGLISGFESERVEDFSLGDPARRPARAARLLLTRTGDATTAARRRANYRFLLEESGARVPPPFRMLPAGACPLIFPVETGDASALVDVLEREGIDASPFWPVLHAGLPSAEFPKAVAWHSRFVAVPVHHELRPRELERVAMALRRHARPA